MKTAIKLITTFVVFNAVTALAAGYFMCDNDKHDPRHAAASKDEVKELEAKHNCGKWSYHDVSGNYDKDAIKKALEEINKGAAAEGKESDQVKPGLEKPASKEPAAGKKEKEGSADKKSDDKE